MRNPCVAIGRRFHVDGDGARQVDAAALLRPAKLPVAIVVGDDRAGAQPLLQRLAAIAGHFGDRLLQGDLHFGERRDRRLRRHRLIEHVVLPEIAVREHVVADLLALAQARAMSNHQPAMRTQHGDVVGDVLGVGGPDADVDQADAAALAHETDRPASGSDARRRRPEATSASSGAVAPRRSTTLPGSTSFSALAAAQLLEAPADELVDIAMIVGEQHPGLHVAPVRARVMHQPAQRIIYPRGVEQSERALGAGTDFKHPVGDFVADDGERGRREMARDVGRADAAAPEFVAALEHVRVGDLLRARPDFDLGAIFARPAARAARADRRENPPAA